MRTKIAIVAGLAIVALGAVAVAQSSGWDFGRFATFMRGAGFGTKLQLGVVNVGPQAAATKGIVVRMPSGATGDAIDIQNSSGSTIAKVAAAGGLTAATVASTGNATVGGNITVTGAVTGGTFNCTTASYTNLNAAGSLAVGTTSTLTGAVTAGAITAPSIKAATGPLSITGGARLGTFTAVASSSIDEEVFIGTFIAPVTFAGIPTEAEAGALFFNGTEWCQITVKATTAKKIKDLSTNCF
jgi:hypothetical protein